MASNYTRNYKLCQWEAGDQVKRTEFNSDNAKIDAAVSGLQSSVSSLSSGKASQSEVDSLSRAVAQHTAELAKKGNCQIYQTSYAGSGRYGADNANSLTFSQKPVLVFIAAPQSKTFLIQGAAASWSEHGGVTQAYPLTLTWSGNTVRWYSTANAAAQMNATGSAYQVVAFLQAD